MQHDLLSVGKTDVPEFDLMLEGRQRFSLRILIDGLWGTEQLFDTGDGRGTFSHVAKGGGERLNGIDDVVKQCEVGQKCGRGQSDLLVQHTLPAEPKNTDKHPHAQ